MKKKASLLLALVLSIELLLSAAIPPARNWNQPAYAASELAITPAPAAGEKNVDVATSIRLSFDKPAKPQSGNITLTPLGASSPYLTIPVGTSGLIGSSSEFELKWGTDKVLESNTTYTVNIPQGLFKDSSGTPSAAASWAFTTKPVTNTDIQASEFAPANNARVDAAALTELSFKLNRKLQKGGGSVKLLSSADNSVVQEFKFKDGEAGIDVQSSGSSTTVILTLASKLAAGRNYYVLIDNYALKDDANRTFGGISSGNVWSFSTKGTSVDVTTVPVSGATNVSPTGDIVLNFDRPMLPAAGIITLAGGTAGARTFNVNSSAVTGGGTRSITIDAASDASPLAGNTAYTVTIPQGAFYDQDGNLFPAAGSYTWSFTTSSLTGYGVSSLTPADRSESVAINQQIKISLNRPSNPNGNLASNGVLLYRSNGTVVESRLEGASADQKEFVIIPTVPLEYDTTYYIDIAPEAFIEEGNNQSRFAGLSGKSSWSFRTVATDKTAPALTSAQLDNNRTIRLKYNETLNSSVMLMSSSFTVTVNDEKRAIESVYILGDSVYITLSTGIAVGQMVKVNYSAGLRTIQDIAGNAAPTFSGQQIANALQSALPAPKEGTLNGKTLVLNFNDTLKPVSSSAYNQFYVYANGVSLGVNSITSSGETVTLGLNNAPASGEIARVTYYAGSYPLQDIYGQNVGSFSDFYVRNTNDTAVPVLQGATGSGNQIVLTYNEGLQNSNLPLNSQFSVLVGNSPNYVTNVAVSGNQVLLTLASSLTAGTAVTVSYVPGVLYINDLNANRAGYINLQPVSVSGTSTGTTNVSGVSGVSVSGDELTVTFSKVMQATSTLANSQFAVRVDGSIVGVQSYYFSGYTLRLVLSVVVKAGQSVDLSYMNGSGRIIDLNGNALAPFSSLSVYNAASSTSSTGRPAYLGTLAASEFGSEYYLLKNDSATLADDRSVYSQSVKRYTVMADRLSASYEYLYKLGTYTLAFEVPATEAGAYVVLPLKPLLEAVNRNSKATFVVRYGDILYRVSLNDIDMSTLSATLLADSSNISLVLRLEKVPAGTFTPLEQKLKTQGLQGVNSLVDVRLTAVLGSNFSNSTALSVPAEVIIRTTSTLNSSQTSMARLDLSYNDSAYLPTQTGSQGAYTVIRGKLRGNQVVGVYLGIRSFSDISTHWSKSTVETLYAKNIIDYSYSPTFKPGQKITRAEFAVMLSRGLGLVGDRQTAQQFRDVQASTQTGDYIGAAAKAGIITGNTDGTFRPDDNITREQLAIMIIRAMEYAGYPVTLSSDTSSALSSFNDRAKIQRQSAEFVAKAVQEGIILGMTKTEFQPQGNATRAQAATMLQRMLSSILYL
ncbi:Ig-like domain-containing protein [Paenibacillus tengchongensis]|uniref:Ig-like domain-containing protein n=1 Tax=Paenibacillus tengchongensis TaxID=2608684 RepID=UPI00124C35DD|nr:Ig-like domain-containing protein [Paenibacillus tengchongensis]